MKALKLIVTGGLANRMKAIISAQRVCDLINRHLLVKWIPWIDWWPSKGVKEMIPWPEPPDWLKVTFTDEDLLHGRDCEVDLNVVDRRNNDDIVMQTWRWIHFTDEDNIDGMNWHKTNLHRNLQPWVHTFFPKPELANTVGVHYRRLHHDITHSVSLPLDILYQNKSAFFTTDDKVTHDFVKSHYPGVYSTKGKEFHVYRDLVNGFTWTDLMQLAASEQIYASKHSTFADLAWHIGGLNTLTFYEDMR
jgi:hypothetical protein